MAKLKKASLRLIICPTCKGNGYLRVETEHNGETTHQCWDCDSEGEFYEETNVYDIDDGNSDRMH